MTRVEPRLAAADEACAAAIYKSIGVFRLFIFDRRREARTFAEDVLALGSKWKLVVSKSPSWLGGDAGAHRDYLGRKFGERLFTGEQMAQAIRAAVGMYLNEVQAIENQLLVDVRADLADLPAGVVQETHSAEIFARRFEQLAADISPRVGDELRTDVARDLGSWVGGEVGARMAIRVVNQMGTRLGVSAGLLGAGAGASWATFGLSVAAAIAIDQAASRMMDWATDPAGRLEERVQMMLDDVSRQVVEGDGAAGGLRLELQKLDSARARLRAEALRRLVLAD